MSQENIPVIPEKSILSTPVTKPASGNPFRPISESSGEKLIFDNDEDENSADSESHSGEKPEGKKRATKGANYTPAEDALLMSAYLSVSEDPVLGTDQKLASVWAKIKEKIDNEIAGGNLLVKKSRPNNSYQKRFTQMQREINKFSAILKRISTSSSGDDEAGILAKSRSEYFQLEKKHFAFDSAYEIARRHPKWTGANLVKETKQAAMNEIETLSTISQSSSPVVSESNRPIGRKAAKRERERNQAEDEKKKVQNLMGQFLEAEKKKAETEEVKLKAIQERTIEMRKERLTETNIQISTAIINIANSINSLQTRLDGIFNMNFENFDDKRKEYYNGQIEQTQQEIEKLKSERAELEKERKNLI